jgi:hypothetical protein
MCPSDRKQRKCVVYLVAHSDFEGHQQVGIQPALERVSRESA